MSHGKLAIRPDGALDFLTLGALVHRLDPGIIPFRKATDCEIHVSGGEFNVAANLSDCFGLNTGIATAMVDYPIGDLIAERVRAMGVQAVLQALRARRRQRPEHGHRLQRPRLRRARPGGLLQPLPTRPAALLKPGDFDWKAIFARRRALVPQRRHLRRALARPPAELIIEGDEGRQGRRRGHLASTSTTARSSGTSAGGDEGAVEVIGRIVEHVDVLVGNEEDLQKGLGIPGPEVAGQVEARSRAPSSA